MSNAPVRHSRKGLVIPFLIVGLALAAWTGWWFYLTQQVETRLAAQVQSLNAAGWTVTHDKVGVSGWPFRVRVALPRTEILTPSGHGVAAPQLVAEASAWNPDHWVVIAPDGLILNRTGKGRIDIKSDGLRMSISHLRDRFPDIRAEMIRPVFTALPGAEAFPLASAQRIQLETRPHLTDGAATTDELDVLFRLIEARGRPGGPVEGATRQGMLSLDAEAVIVGASHLRGLDSAGVFSAFTAAGGKFTDVRGEVRAGESRARISSAVLQAGPDGRLIGDLAVSAERPMEAIAGLAGAASGSVNRVGAAGAAAAAGASDAASGDKPVDLIIRFENGRTWLGPFALTPAPKLF